VQIRKHKDYRVNELAEFIEHLQDVKFHIKPFEMAEEIVTFMDFMRGKEYARKIQEYIKDNNSYKGEKDKV
jgi:hypothetical protein